MERARSGVRSEPAPRSTGGAGNVFETLGTCRGRLAAPLAGNERCAVARVARVPIGFAGEGRGHEPVAEERALEALGGRCVVGRDATCEKE